MGDPLSATASIVSILQLATAVTGYLKDVKGGSGDRQRLRDEIRSTVCLLEMLKDRIEDAEAGETRFTAIESLNTPCGPLDQFKQTLDTLVSKLAPASRIKQKTQMLQWPFDKKDISSLMATIERQKSLFNLALQNDHIKLSQSIKSDIEGLTKSVARLKNEREDGTSVLIEKMLPASKILQCLEVLQFTEAASNQRHQSRDQEMINWISTLNSGMKQIEALDKRHPGTGEWLIHDATFQNWLHGPGGALLCQGIPGAGKTVITSIVVDHLQRTYSTQSSGDIGIAFVYCNYKEVEQNAASLIASLLQQLVKQQPSVPDDVFVVVDALDESPEETRRELIVEILKLRQDLRFIATSRHNVDTEHLFRDASLLEIRADDADVKSYVHGQIDRGGRLGRFVQADPSLREKIVESIVSKAQGMFLVAQLHIKSLERKHDRKAVRVALAGLPQEVDEIYDDALNRINNQNRDDAELAERILMWVTFATRPLKVKEVQHAIAVMNLEPGETHIDEDGLPEEDVLLTVCAGIVVIGKETSVVQLVHYTTQEYFERVRFDRFPTAQASIAKACLAYLSLDNTKMSPCSDRSAMECLLQENPLMDYAAVNWGSHARGPPERTLLANIMDLLTDGALVIMIAIHLFQR
ncbi:hypothetical protein LTR50_005472 [Elasticomyces elasticus]|nr:hypothetical protein LTR50_005472 [Elasticomyces elasticus]